MGKKKRLSAEMRELEQMVLKHKTDMNKTIQEIADKLSKFQFAYDGLYRSYKETLLENYELREKNRKLGDLIYKQEGGQDDSTEDGTESTE